MTALPSASTTVARIATECPGAAGLFERLGIDYCCGGKMPLEIACRRRGLKTEDVLAQLAKTASEPEQQVQEWPGMSATDLANHIESTHHKYLKSELPRLRKLAEKVAAVHGDSHPELCTLAETFSKFSEDMISHMDEEENVLFPTLRAKERGDFQLPVHIDRTIACMTHEHEEAGRALEQFRFLTHDYTPPEVACNSWRVLLGDLKRLECDMHEHVHKENNILFAKALSSSGPV